MTACKRRKEGKRERFPLPGQKALTPHSVSTAGFGEPVLPSSGMLSPFCDPKLKIKENRKGGISTKNKEERNEISALLFYLWDCWLPGLD